MQNRQLRWAGNPLQRGIMRDLDLPAMGCNCVPDVLHCKNVGEEDVGFLDGVAE